MSYILITGSCGLVGAEAVKFFNQKKFKIIELTIIIGKNFLVQQHQ